MKRPCFEALGIFLFAAALSLSVNYVRSDGLPLVRQNSNLQKASADGGGAEPFLTIEMFLAAITHSNIVVLDARSQEDFDEAHIPGARSLPEDKVAEHFHEVLQGVFFDQEIVVYCHGDECDTAAEVAIFLLDAGYTNTKVYSGGWEEWEALGLPVESEY